MTRIEVTTRVDVSGKLIPISFIYQGLFLRVDEIGREWEDTEGRHVLVMVTPGGNVYELVHQQNGDWIVAKGHDRPTVKLA